MSRGSMRRGGLRVMMCAVLAASSGCVLASGEEGVPIPDGAADARRGGELVVALAEPGAIEPTFASSPGGLLIASTICDTLVHLDPVTGAVVPGLAKSWTVTPGTSATGSGQTITFKLHEDLRFHGTDETLTARDVLFSLSRLADPAEGTYLARLIDAVVGWEKYRAPKDRSTRLHGVQVVEEYGVQIQLTDGDPDAIALFAHPATAPISRSAAEANPIRTGRRPVCVGPYMLAEPAASGDDEVVLVRDERYAASSRAYSLGGAGYADRIRLRVHPSGADALRAFEAGAADVAWLPGEHAERIRSARPGDVLLGPDLSVEFLGIPTKGVEGTALDGLDDPRARRALSLALDRRALSAAASGGLRAPATGFAPSHLRGAATACGATVAERSDVTAARRLMADAKVDLRGRRIPLFFNDEFGHRALASEAARQLASAFGVTVEPRALPWDAFLDRGSTGSGIGGLFRVSWSTSVPSIEKHLVAHAAPDGDGPNFARFSTPASDRARYRIREAHAEDRRLEQAKLAEQLCEALPAIPLLSGTAAWVARARSVGIARDRVIDAAGRPALRELYVKGADR